MTGLIPLLIGGGVIPIAPDLIGLTLVNWFKGGTVAQGGGINVSGGATDFWLDAQNPGTPNALQIPHSQYQVSNVNSLTCPLIDTAIMNGIFKTANGINQKIILNLTSFSIFFVLKSDGISTVYNNGIFDSWGSNVATGSRFYIRQLSTGNMLINVSDGLGINIQVTFAFDLENSLSGDIFAVSFDSTTGTLRVWHNGNYYQNINGAFTPVTFANTGAGGSQQPAGALMQSTTTVSPTALFSGNFCELFAFSDILTTADNDKINSLIKYETNKFNFPFIAMP